MCVCIKRDFRKHNNDKLIIQIQIIIIIIMTIMIMMMMTMMMMMMMMMMMINIIHNPRSHERDSNTHRDWCTWNYLEESKCLVCEVESA